jgi:PAS domain S-box-containing protein
MLTTHADRRSDRCNSAQIPIFGEGQFGAMQMDSPRRSVGESEFGWRRARVLFMLLCILSCSAGRGDEAIAQPGKKNVLCLFSSVKYSEDFLNVVEPFIRAQVRDPITFYDAYLDDPQVEQTLYRESMAETLRRRYAGVKMDVVIASNPAALNFAVQYRDRIFAGVPIVFNGVSSGEESRNNPGVTGVLSPRGFRETIDLALRLQPDTRAIAVVAGITNWDSRQLAEMHSELLRNQDTVKEIDIIGPPDRELLRRVTALPPHTVVFLQMYPQFSNQEEFGVWDLLSEIAKRVPTYSAFPRLCVGGCIGGAYLDNRKEWLLTAGIAARLLSGERAENTPIFIDANSQVQVDWRQLQRWQIGESAVPPGALVLYRQPTLWERYRNYILAAVALVLIQALAIAGLLWQRARKRKAEAVLRESEERFRLMTDTTPALVWMCNAEGKITYLNRRWLSFINPERKAADDGFGSAHVHPDDVKNMQDALTHALKDREPFSREYRLYQNDGACCWMLDVASPRANGEGTFVGFIGSAIDVTDQKLAQQALKNVSGQLIEAQENERARIARELHDDICQRMALLSIEIEKAHHFQKTSASAATSKSLETIQQHCIQIAQDIQSLSHELHSSSLETLGAVSAIQRLCKEYSIQHGVDVDFAERNMPRKLPRDVSLCLFRVTQEALHNAVKYSGVSQFSVTLSATESDVQLEVIDAGGGFDVDEAKKRRGLGMISMQERAHLVHGRFAVESKPGMGTKILAVVPLSVDGSRMGNGAAKANVMEVG